MKKPHKISIIDYRMSNMFSIKNALDMLGYECEVTSDREKILSSDGAILPGVGSFPEAMNHIKELKLGTTIKDFISSGKPFVGICLGFQLLFEESEELVTTSGLGIMKGRVENFAKYGLSLRVPHVGWNSVKKTKLNKHNTSTEQNDYIDDEEYLYFVHSCFVNPDEKGSIYTTTEYSGIQFCSSILKDNIFACQFHPEKSGGIGINILNQVFNNRVVN